ncbi:nuclear transport factor 2 family protein [Streptomyces sp. NPDC058955]|uniref:nuclear transport factor 2 family protein n=1 Tax=unclassified Streptomyces TaxID=2593676 RepID=UPI00365CC678
MSLAPPPVLPAPPSSPRNTTDSPRAPRPSTPYELYIRLAVLRSAWEGPGRSAASAAESAGRTALRLARRLLADVGEDRRPYVDREQRRERCAAVLRDGRTAVLEAGRALGPVRGATAPAEDLLAALRPRRPAGPEDHLFRGAHQMTECWLRVAEVCADEALLAAGARDWTRGTRLLRAAGTAVARATQAGQLLDLMDLADYHPLRLMLRDGSGAQSEAARGLPLRVRAVFDALESRVRADGRTLVHVLSRTPPTGETAADHGATSFDVTAELHYLRAVRALAKTCQEFLFLHYLLALDVLGAHNTGSLGYDIASMAQRASAPLLPSLDRALYDYAKLTDLWYADLGGRLILADEPAADPHLAPPGATEPAETPADLAERTVAAYFARLADGDVAGWTLLFHEEGRLVELPGTRPFTGRARLAVFVESTLRQFPRMRPTILRVDRTGARTFRADWSIEADSYLGPTAHLRGVEEFTLTADATILEARTDWNPRQVAARLWPGIAPHPVSLAWP